MTELALCHVFAFVSPGAPERAALEAAGLRESFRRRHPGQGTTNVCYCLDNAYIELLWVEDAGELASPPIARTRLAERSRWRETGTSPFGIGLRRTGEGLPFPTWDFTPPYLPPGMAIPVSLGSEDPAQPFIFVSPGATRPDAWTDGRAGERQTATGLTDIVSVELDVSGEPGADLRALEAAGVVRLVPGAVPSMVLTLSGPAGTRRLELPGCGWV
ncbi:MAG TPA: VOC family protein [Azospirillaceae bacterium]|nr:VOC family protein [Azospirillaceae bacterium]